MKETAIVAAGELLLSAAMVGVFAALGYFKMNVLWSALTGCAVASHDIPVGLLCRCLFLARGKSYRRVRQCTANRRSHAELYRKNAIKNAFQARIVL
jgi:hypothetical protein